MPFLITTAIDYVNGSPHLGHAYEKIATDVIARHMRQRGGDVFFLTGADEHGEPIADTAAAEGITPQELVDRSVASFKALLQALDISNDFYVRTTDEGHKRRVQEVMQRIHDNGYTYKGLYEGWYCPRCADFKVENEILEGNRCPIHEIALIRETEENWFFKLSDFQVELEALYADHPSFVMPLARYNEALSFIQSGLQDVSLSRAHLKWGITVPWDPAHVFYVWFDALLNYYTALSYARPGEDLTELFWPATFHVIGKDILKFHPVFWPAMLMAAGLPLPEHVFVHGMLLGADGRKMSKSLGNGFDPAEALDVFGVDALRFYLMREVQFGADGPVGMDALKARYDNELANEYGNLASRTIAMVRRYRDGVVPEVELDPALRGEFDTLADEVCDLIDGAEVTAALDLVWQRVRRCNRYVEERAPWALAKQDHPEAHHELNVVLASLTEAVRVISVLLTPYLPQATATLLQALGSPLASIDQAAFAPRGSGSLVEAIEPLFPRR
ncbi:MAG: class I tRNA ligase family protein [Solirubrobacteraceae bacterium]